MTKVKKKSLDDFLKDFTKLASETELSILLKESTKRKLTREEVMKIKEIAKRLASLS